MQHLPNKHFNSYKEGLDLEFLRAYCMEYGERRSFERGETLEEAGRAGVVGGPTWRGCFKYVTRGYWLQQGWHQNASRATFLMAVSIR